jgi:hypothetical protein
MPGRLCHDMLGSIVFAAPSSNNTITPGDRAGSCWWPASEQQRPLPEPSDAALPFTTPYRTEIFDVAIDASNWGLIGWRFGRPARYAVVYRRLPGACLPSGAFN